MEGTRAAAVHDRDARWVPALTCAGLGGCYNGGEPRRNEGSVMTCLEPTLTCAVLGGVMKRRGAEEERRSAHAVAGLALGPPLRGDDGYASGRGGVTAGGARVKGP